MSEDEETMRLEDIGDSGAVGVMTSGGIVSYSSGGSTTAAVWKLTRKNLGDIVGSSTSFTDSLSKKVN